MIYVGASTDFRKQLLQTFHSSALGEHSGSKATYYRLKKVFYWPNMKKHIEEFVSQCPVCQLNKVEHIHPPGLLQPHHVPDMAWAHITMDFITTLPNSQGKEVILVVVDKLTKYSHFIPLACPFTVQTMFEALMDNVIKLHCLLICIVPDRVTIFTSNLYQELFQAFGVKIRFSTASHPQIDDQTKRVNQYLEAYLRGMVFQEPKKWLKWLPLAELWYNTSYHSSLKCTPFQALYGYKPPQVREFAVERTLSPTTRLTMAEREQMMQKLKANLEHAQSRMKHFADRNRTERTFEVGDMVYLKIQPLDRMVLVSEDH